MQKDGEGKVTLSSILTMLGGIGLFLYGMKLMGQSLERFAGAKMEKTLEILTSNKAKGVALGAGVTAVIQSSAATIIMVIGFLNAGIMKLVQAVPVIMGANIGTTITAQILSLGDIDSGNFFLTMLKPSSFAPVCVAVAAFTILMSKKNKTKDKAGIAMGLGILFIGMTMMESSFAPLAESDEFVKMLLLLTNPVLGVLAGAFVTILLQSSSASVGVLQAMTATGAITFSIAAPMVIGANVGKCVTVLLASIGTNKNAKRAVCVDVLMCVAGAVLFLAGIYFYQWIIGFGFWESTMNRSNVANFHTLFNTVVCIVMLPLCNVLIAAANMIVKDKPGSNKIDEELALLDNIFIKNPVIALEQSKKVIISMGEAAGENLDIAIRLLKKYDEKDMDLLKENERFLDKSETMLGDYLIKITEQNITEAQNRLATEMMHTVSDFERIGDHCMNLAEISEANIEQNIDYSDKGKSDLEKMARPIRDILEMTVKAYKEEDEEICHYIWPLEDTIDELVDDLKAQHVTRLKEGKCTTHSGVGFIEMLGNMERISDHCNNVAVHLHQRVTNGNLDKHHKEIFNRETDAYKELCEQYEKKYLYV